MDKDVVHLYNRILAIGSLVTKSCPTLVIPWTVACQTPLSIGFSRQEYWTGLPFPSPRGLPDPGIETWSSALQAVSSLTELPWKPVLTIKKDEIMPFAETWMKMEIMILSEVSQTEKYKYHMISLTYRI